MWELSIDYVYVKIMLKERYSESEAQYLEKILLCLQELREKSGSLKNFADIYEIVKKELDVWQYKSSQLQRVANQAVNILVFIRGLGGLDIIDQTSNGFIINRPISETRLHEINLALRTKYSMDLRMEQHRHQRRQ